MENSRDIEKYIKQLCTMSLTELKELKERDRIELEALEAKYKAAKMKNIRLKERYRKIDKDVAEANKTREKMKEKIATLEYNNDQMQKTLIEFDQEKADLTKSFRESFVNVKAMKKLIDDKCLEIRGFRDDFKKKYLELQADVKEAYMELSHKKESLAANRQVLESKKACLAKDYQDCVKKAKELKLMTDKNNEALLKEMEQMEEDMKIEFSDLSAKHAELIKYSENLDAKKVSLEVETEKLSMELAVEEKCNQKLEAEFKSEIENIEQLTLKLLESQANARHFENIEITKILRDDLIENQAILNEIKLLETEKSEIENKNWQFDAIKEQKLDQLKKLQIMIENKIEKKILLEKEVNDLKIYAAEKVNNSHLIKKKIVEVKEALEKRTATKKVPRLTAIKGATQQPKKTKVTESQRKSLRVTSQKDKKKEPPATKLKASTQVATKQKKVLNEEPITKELSSSSNLSDFDFSMSSELAGSKPDIMDILNNLSDSQYLRSYSGRQSSDSKEQ